MTRRLLTALAATALILATSACWAAPATTAPQLVLSPGGSAGGRALVKHLPDSLTFSDRMGTAQVARLPSAVQVPAGPPVVAYRTGDVVYWPAENSLIIFTTDGAGVAEGDLVQVGSVTEGLSGLSGCVRQCRVAILTETSPTSP